ncbi:hypothetical protein [Paraburkholderia xenovorans]|uniref:hypothetical protein n=1 Tax=Paraburkholderia xenovorans TaxID=36873 RepID=UPI0015C57056|nr:hypothetical protein [Paraburkholderia xenovorans]NPT38555.1 hypothetical protein [Paraburkholderia xenovorans]
MALTQQQIDERLLRTKRLIARRVREARSKSRFKRVGGRLRKNPTGERGRLERMYAGLAASADRLISALVAENSARRK